jgi:hypothetical protein
VEFCEEIRPPNEAISDEITNEDLELLRAAFPFPVNFLRFQQNNR